MQVHPQCNRALAGRAHTNRINMDEQDGYKGKEAREGVNQRININPVAQLTSAEEYPDDEYLDMSKSSSLK